MDYQSRNLVLLTALLAGIAGLSGIARAELIEPAVPNQPSIKADQPLPLPRPMPQANAQQAIAPQATAIHRPSPVRPVAAILPPRPQQPHCAWFGCGGQYIIVGIGF
jgi:hypothetical protein